MLRTLGALALIAVLGAGILLYSVYSPHKGFTSDVYLDFPKGTSTRAMGDQLAREGVIKYSWQFLVARALRPSARLQAGEYRFTRADSAANVLARIARGDVYYHELTVPEGSNIFDISSIVADTGIIDARAFLKAAADVSLIRDLDPKATTLEGYLFPSTYRITRRTTADQLVRMMTDQFRKQWAALGAKANVHDTVTLASLVEKETGVKEERPIVASVYANRLRIGMKLDCDPTTIYAAMLEDRYRGVIHQSDLASRNEYNTYQHAGLPPGPIANPGLASLKAALQPAGTNYLYFVAKADGGGAHTFSADYAAHERAVAEYRRGRRQAR